MRCAVNLVPAGQIHARTHARRRAGWISVCAALGLLLATAWGIQHTAASVLARALARVSALEVQRAEVKRRLLTVNAQTNESVGQLQTIAAARRPQPWARRLVALTRAVPAGVLLTELSVTTPQADRRRAAGAHVREGARQQGHKGAADNAAKRFQNVRLRGYALDHGALIQLLNCLQELPDWQQVELVRATQEPYRSGLAIAFELDCRTQEGRP